MSLSNGEVSRLQAWLEEQLPLVTDDASSGLVEYILGVVQSSAAETAESGSSDSLASRLEERLHEFLDSRTHAFVTDLVATMHTGLAPSPPAMPTSRPQEVPADDDDAVEVDYDEPAFEEPTAHTDASQLHVPADEQPQPMEDETAAAGGAKRKRRDEDEDEEGRSSAAAAAAATEESAPKRARADRPKRPCFDFQRRGTCNRGAACHFEHAPRPAPQPSAATTAFPMAPFAPFGVQPIPPFGAPHMMTQQQQQQWQMQQQMAMQLAMQQQYMMQQQQPMQPQAPSQLIADDDTEILLTGQSSNAALLPLPSSDTPQGGTNGIARSDAPARRGGRGGLGFQPSARQRQPNDAAPRFVSSSTRDMEATHRPAQSSEGTVEDSKESHTEPIASVIDDEDETEAASFTSAHRSGAGAAIPFTYPTRGGGRGGRGGRGGGRGGFGGVSSHASGSGTRLYLSHVPKELCTLMALSPHFAQFGTVVSLKVLGDNAAIVEMSTPAEAQAAMASPAAVLDNRFIQLDWTRGDGPASSRHHHHPHAPYHKPMHATAAATAAAPSVAPPAQAPLSALEVARALMASKANGTGAATAASSASEPAPAPAAPASEMTSVASASAPAPPPAPSTVASTSTTSESKAARLQAMRAQLAASIAAKQAATRKELLARLAAESSTLTLTEKQALMARIAAINAEMKRDAVTTASGHTAPAASGSQPAAPAVAPNATSSSDPALAAAGTTVGTTSTNVTPTKLSALEVVAAMKKARQAEAEAKQAAAAQ